MTTIKLLVVIEATTVSGPAKNLLGFFRLLRSPEFQSEDLPRMEFSIVTFHRAGRLKLDDNDSSVTTRPPNAFVAAALAQGVEVDVISERFLLDPGVIGQLRNFVARRAPNVVQTHMVKSHFLTKLSGIGREYPWVAYHHGYTSTDLKMRGYNQLNRWSLPSASRVITVCGAFAHDLARAGVKPDRISVCHNSVGPPVYESPEDGKTLRSQLGIRESEQVVLSVGRLSLEKGHVDLVRALAALSKVSPSLRPKLLIVGDGPERERIETTARANGVYEQLIFTGHTADVSQYYALADILALPSHSEGSPNVLLEAMSAGLPVVATAVGGVPEIAADNETALLVAPNDISGFSQAMSRLLTDRALAQKLGRAAELHVREKFSPATHARSLLEIYDKLVNKTGTVRSI
jgi:glycosyltransferase involved in cell wall biosynthesis